MKLVLISDVHLLVKNPRSRLDHLPHTQWDKLEYVFKQAEKRSGIVIQAGDFTDVPRSWFLLSKMAQFLTKHPNVSVYSIFGQHDTYLYSEESRQATILGTLHDAGLVTILTEKPTYIGGGKIALYGASFGAKVPKPVNRDQHNILVVHDNISDKGLFRGHKYTTAEKYATSMSDRGFDLVLCGDIHKHFHCHRKACGLVNTGPLLRTTSAKHIRKHKPRLGIYDTKKRKMTFKRIPASPPATVLLPSSTKRDQSSSESLNDFLQKIEGFRNQKSTNRPSIKENIARILKKSKASKKIRKALSEIIDNE